MIIGILGLIPNYDSDIINAFNLVAVLIENEMHGTILTLNF